MYPFKVYLNLFRLGLIFGFVGAVIVAFSGYFSLPIGFQNSLMWANRGLWWIGWTFLAMGFGLQWFATKANDVRKNSNRGESAWIKRLDIQNIDYISIILFLFFSGIIIYQLMHGKSWGELFSSQISVYVGIIGISISFRLSQSSIRRIEKSLYPDDFEAQVIGSESVKPTEIFAHTISINGKAIQFKEYGFRFGIKNASEKYPASNVFVKVQFEKNKFMMDGEELTEDSHNIKMQGKMRGIYQNIQCLTVDKTVLGVGVERKETEFVGIGLIIPSIPPLINIFFFITMKIELKENMGMVIVDINKNRCIFNYQIKGSINKENDILSSETQLTGATPDYMATSILSSLSSSATPIMQLTDKRGLNSKRGKKKH